MSDEFDPARFKAREKKGWDLAAEDWASQLGRLTAALAEQLVDYAEVVPGDRVLDVATGSGVVALAARRRLGEKAVVVGTDISPQLLTIAAKTAEHEGYTDITWMEMDAEALEVKPHTFTVALSQLGLMYVPDKLAMLRGMRRELAAHGRIVLAVWADASRCDLAGTADVAAPYAAGPPLPGTPGLWDMGDPALHQELLTEVGFAEVEHQFVRHDWHFASAEHGAQAMFDATGTMRPFYYKQTPEVQQALMNDMVAFFKAHPAADGGVVLKNEVLLVRARKP
jgi:SAM-dependent methyltransferase